MLGVSNINYYYRHAMQSNGVKKLITSTSALAFYTFQGFQYAAIAPLGISSLTSLLPVSIISFLKQHADRALEKWQERISDQSPSHPLHGVIHRVELIMHLIFKNSLAFSEKALCLPLGIIAIASFFSILQLNKGGEYIEDLSTRISQKALDTLGIPVQLSISQRQLKSILKNWESRALPGENRQLACKEILDCYKRSRSLIRSSYTFLSLTNYQLRDLPDIFHYNFFSHIKRLELSFNQLTSLPPSITELKRLEYLNLAHNNLSTFPAVLSSLPNACEVSVAFNRFSREEVERIVATINQNVFEGPSITGLSIYEGPDHIHTIRDNHGQSITTNSVDEFYSALYRSINREQRDLSNLEKSQDLQLWLHRLTDLSRYEDHKKILHRTIINFLEEANQNEKFKIIFTKVIEEASGTCGDRVALSILHLDIFYQLEKIDFTDMKKLATFLLRGCWAIQLLEQCAREKVATMRGVDEIEVYLGYPIALKQELELPISQDSMCYFSCSNLTPQDLDNAKEFVESHCDNKDAALNFLIQHDKWSEALRHNKASVIAAIEREREQASNASSPDYEAIQNRYDQALKDLSRQILDW